MVPTKVSIGIEAKDVTEAEDILKERYGDQLNFEILYLDVAEDDVARDLRQPKIN